MANEKIISDKRSWVVSIKSAGNILQGENYVYAFPEAILNKSIVKEGEVVSQLTLIKNSISSNYLKRQIQILLDSTLAEVKRRGSLVTEIQVDSNSINQIFKEFNDVKDINLKLEAISQSNIDRVGKVNVFIKSRRLMDSL